jgi:hypothetical protein
VGLFPSLKNSHDDQQGPCELDATLLPWWMGRGILSVVTSCFGLPAEFGGGCLEFQTGLFPAAISISGLFGGLKQATSIMPVKHETNLMGLCLGEWLSSFLSVATVCLGFLA